MIDYSALYQAIPNTKLAPWLEILPQQITSSIEASAHGDLDKWLAILAALPPAAPSSIDLRSDIIRVGTSTDITEAARQQLERLLRQLHPWRKGPFSLFGINIDTEWRSDLKWQRVQPYLSALDNRTILDVGCGSGYHCWRMAGENAKLVIGIDPTLLYVMQFFALQHYIRNDSVHVLPLGIDDVPAGLEAFDSVFSMGVLYHRRSPIDHLYQLKDCLRTGGELVLETLVIDGELGASLLPKQRYAKMRNVWFIPSCLTLESWLLRCGFNHVRLVDVSRTTSLEQRSTDWMRFESLENFLDPSDSSLTAEGYPAPQRAVFVAEKA